MSDTKSNKSHIRPKTWDEFGQTGLFFLVNQFLHIFGWVLVLAVEDGQVKSVSPARTDFRGFDNAVTSEQYIKISQYMKDNVDELLEEAKS